MSREWMVFLNEGVILEAYQIVGNNRRINGIKKLTTGH